MCRLTTDSYLQELKKQLNYHAAADWFTAEHCVVVHVKYRTPEWCYPLGQAVHAGRSHEEVAAQRTCGARLQDLAGHFLREVLRSDSG